MVPFLVTRISKSFTNLEVEEFVAVVAVPGRSVQDIDARRGPPLASTCIWYDPPFARDNSLTIDDVPLPVIVSAAFLAFNNPQP